ncbi:MAG: M15 family metallopeptidase [Solobacterium sp.]|nr:M15 family metallopeptidase [Solobacterium sp.]
MPADDTASHNNDQTQDQTVKPENEKKPEPQTADVRSNSSLLRIVSPAAKIDPDYVPSQLVIPDVPMYQTQELRPEAASALEDMFAAAAQDGYDLYLISGFRSYDYQVGLWNYYVDYFGLSYTEHIDAHPGGSEHQLGLSVDIGTTDDVCRLDTCFGETGAFAWLQENSYKFGYIERYPLNKEAVTGIMYSPWSFRYTGKEEAEKLHQSSQTMEEYYHMN